MTPEILIIVTQYFFLVTCIVYFIVPKQLYYIVGIIAGILTAPFVDFLKRFFM